MTKFIRSTIYIDPQLNKFLRLISALEQKSMSEVVNESLKDYLAKYDLDALIATSKSMQRDP